MKWITRQNASVDRIACPWLIKRFVDADAEFLYVPADEVMAVAARESATPYDVKNVELGHVDGRCSFESIMAKYGLDDPGLKRLAQIASRNPPSAMGTPSANAVVNPAVSALLISACVGWAPAR